MARVVALTACLLLACGEDAVVDPSTTGGGTSTGPGPVTTGGGGDDSSSTGAPTSDGSADATGSSGGESSTGTTQAIDPTTSSSGDETSSGGGTSTTTGETTGTSTSTTGESSGTSTSEGASTTTGESTGDETTDTDTGGVLPMPAGQCTTNDLTLFVSPMPGPSELHIVAVYQPVGGAITVDVTRVGVPLTLVLNSYEPVDYTLNLAPGVILEEVILDGYNPHTVQGQGGATVTDLSGQFMYLAACGYFWPMNDGGCDTPGLVAGAEAQTGLELTSFVGCYEGASFTVG